MDIENDPENKPIHPVDVLLALAESRARAEGREIDRAAFERLRRLCDERVPTPPFMPPEQGE